MEVIFSIVQGDRWRLVRRTRCNENDCSLALIVVVTCWLYKITTLRVRSFPLQSN